MTENRIIISIFMQCEWSINFEHKYDHISFIFIINTVNIYLPYLLEILLPQLGLYSETEYYKRGVSFQLESDTI